ncbi:MAG: hypothetical protein GWO87_02330, partial [Xanthomonadaceae bacterium]|nr:hypothetical protein [Rhodospirillaceae bacterium]NIA18004.1 hypothetical protein [Xanthomonadaceae bacterium]
KNSGEEPDELNEDDKKAEQICTAIENSVDFSEKKKLFQELWDVYDKVRKPLQKTSYQESKDLIRNLSELINDLNNSKKIKYKKRIERIVAKPKKGIEEMQKTNKELWRILRQARNDLIAVPDLKKEKGKKELWVKIKNVHNDILNIISKDFKVKALKQRANNINEKLNKDINIKDLEDILSEMVLIRSDINEIISKPKYKKEKEKEKKEESGKVEAGAQTDNKIIDEASKKSSQELNEIDFGIKDELSKKGTGLTDEKISELYNNAERNLKWLNRQGVSWLDYKIPAEETGISQEQIQEKAEELWKNDIEYYSKIIKAIESNNTEEAKKLNDERKIRNEILDLEMQIRDDKNEIKQTEEKLSKMGIEYDNLKTKGFNSPEKAKKELSDYLNVLKNHLQELQNHLLELNEKVRKENFIGEEKMRAEIGDDYQRIKEIVEQFEQNDEKQSLLKEAQDLFETSKQAETRSQLNKIFHGLREIRNIVFVDSLKKESKNQTKKTENKEKDEKEEESKNKRGEDKENFMGEKTMRAKIEDDYQRIKEIVEQYFKQDDKKQEFLKEMKDLFETSKQVKTRSQLDKIFHKLRAIRNTLFVESTKKGNEDQTKLETEKFGSLSIEEKDERIDEALEKLKDYLNILGKIGIKTIGTKGAVKRQSNQFGKTKIGFYKISENLIKKAGAVFGREFEEINLEEKAILEQAAKLVKQKLDFLEQGPAKEITRLKKDIEKINKREKKDLSVFGKTSEKISKKYKKRLASQKDMIRKQIEEKQKYLKEELENISVGEVEDLEVFTNDLNNLRKNIFEEENRIIKNMKKIKRSLKKKKIEKGIREEIKTKLEEEKKQLKELKIKEMELAFSLKQFNKRKKELEIFLKQIKRIKQVIQ